jgi:hypothetical protein
MTASGESWNTTIRIIPAQEYVPTEAEIQKAASNGNQIYNVTATFEELSDGTPQYVMSYFVPYEAMPEDLRASIQGSTTVATFILPAADAADSKAGAVFETAIKGVGKETIGKAMDKSAPFKKISDLYSILDSLGKVASDLYDYDKSLDGMSDCVNNPSNPLTKTTYDENPAEKQKAMDAIDSARSDANWNTFARYANYGSKVALKFAPSGSIPGAAKIGVDSAVKYNDETLKELTKNSIDDASKSVVPCQNEVPTQTIPLALLHPMQANVEYKYTMNEETCGTGGDCYRREEHRLITGSFVLNPDKTSLPSLGGNGTATVEMTSSSTNTQPPDNEDVNYSLESLSKTTGTLDVKATGISTPFGSKVEVNFYSETLDNQVTGKYMGAKPGGDGRTVIEKTPMNNDNAIFGHTCTFDGVDLLKGGSYSVFTDNGHGTCKLELFSAS